MSPASCRLGRRPATCRPWCCRYCHDRPRRAKTWRSSFGGRHCRHRVRYGYGCRSSALRGTGHGDIGAVGGRVTDFWLQSTAAMLLPIAAVAMLAPMAASTHIWSPWPGAPLPSASVATSPPFATSEKTPNPFQQLQRRVKRRCRLPPQPVVCRRHHRHRPTARPVWCTRPARRGPRLYTCCTRTTSWRPSLLCNAFDSVITIIQPNRQEQRVLLAPREVLAECRLAAIRRNRCRRGRFGRQLRRKGRGPCRIAGRSLAGCLWFGPCACPPSRPASNAKNGSGFTLILIRHGDRQATPSRSADNPSIPEGIGL